MTEETERKGLTPDERIFLQALDTANADLMISIFTKVNGILNEENFKTLIADEPDETPTPERADLSKSNNITLEKSAPADLEEVAESTIKFIAAWRAKDADTLQGMVDQLRGAPLPASHVARERTRARAIAPEIRFRLPGMLEDIHQVIDDTACQISHARPNGQKESAFEEDAISTQMLHGICDFFSLYPNINQMSSEYHVRPYFDLEYDYSKKMLKALDPAGNVIAVEDYSDPDGE